MKKYLVLAFCLVPSLVFAFPLAATKDVREVDGDITTYLRVLSGSPTVTITSQVCDEQLQGNVNDCSEPFSHGTITAASSRLSFKGPMTKVTATVTGGSGHGEVWTCGRIAP
jgi:hypothetical protein